VLSTAPLTGRPHLSVAPPPGTVPRPTRQAPLSPLCSTGTRARGTRRPRVPRSGRCRATTAGRGQAPRHPHARDPHLFPSPFSLCRATAEPLAPRYRVDSSSRPHSSPTPSVERLSFPTAPRTQTAASGHRQPPLPRGFRPSTAAVRHSPGSSSPSYRTSSPPLATTGAPSLPTNAAARRRWHRLTVDPPFRCAPVLSSLPGTFPVTPSRSPTSPCRRRATTEPPVSTPPRRRAQQAVQASCPVGLGCQAVAQPAFRPTARGRTPRPVSSSLVPVSAWYCAGDFKCFFNCFKSQKLVQTSKICRNL
jgi:hypothetical protein